MSDATNYFDMPRQGYAVSQTEVRALRERIAELEADRDDARRVMKEACEANRVFVARLDAVKQWLNDEWTLTEQQRQGCLKALEQK